MKQPAAVLGVGQTQHRAKRTDVSIAGLCREAVDRALADAGLSLADIDAVVVGKAPDLFEGVMMPELYLADALGAVGKPLLRVHTAGSVGGATGDRRDQPGPGGRCTGGCWRWRSRSSRSPTRCGRCRSRRRSACRCSPAPAATSRRTSAPTSGAAARRRTSARWSRSRTGATAPSTRTPTCSSADITLETVQASPMLWDPIRYDETCPSSDGACAVVIGDEDAAAAAAGPGGLDPGHRDAQRADHVRRARTTSTRAAGRECGGGAVAAGRHHRPARTRSTWPRSTCRSPGSSRCGWRTSASPRPGDGWKLTEAGETALGGQAAGQPVAAACSAPTRSAPPGCSGSPRRRCR